MQLRHCVFLCSLIAVPATAGAAGRTEGGGGPFIEEGGKLEPKQLQRASRSRTGSEEAFGDVIQAITPDTTGNGRAVAHDPASGDVYYTFSGSTLIYITNPLNDPTTNINPGFTCGALAWDAKRGVLWCGSYDGSGDIYTINPADGTPTFEFNFAEVALSCYGASADPFMDGLGYDEGPTSGNSDDRIWLSGDAGGTLFEFDLGGVLQNTFAIPTTTAGGSCNTGITVDGECIWLALQTGGDVPPHEIIRVRKSDPTTVELRFTFNDANPAMEDIHIDLATFAPTPALITNNFGAMELIWWEIEACNAPPICDAGGPYVEECSGPRTTVNLDGSGSSDPDEDPLTFAWDTDCPNGDIDPSDGETPTLSLDGPPPCPVDCTVTLTVDDGVNPPVSCSADVTVDDTIDPVPMAALNPVAPAPPQAVSSCAPSSRAAFEVLCSAGDACDPDPSVNATLVVTNNDVPTAGTCVPRVDVIDVDCGEVVEIELVPPACADRPSSPRPAVTVNSAGVRVISGESVVLEVTAEDACRNDATASFDPAAEPSPGCEQQLPTGECCPAVGAGAGGRCNDPCPAPLRDAGSRSRLTSPSGRQR